jgi:hypothetical protein
VSPEAPSAGAGGQARVRALNCSNCGASLTVRSFEHAISIVCPSCHAILDARDPNLAILQKAEAATTQYNPRIPLGKRGKIRGTEYEAIGFQVRSISVEGTTYHWDEYLLFNPNKGFRYLSQYEGHWNDISTLRSLPQVVPSAIPEVIYLGEKYKHFQSAEATTSFVLGEFPWQVRVGEKVQVTDYVHPPRMISSERTGDEISWSLGEYMSPGDVWSAFTLSGDPPTPQGVFENQPSPLGANVKAIWSICALLLAAFVVLFIAIVGLARGETVHSGDYVFDMSKPGEQSFVTPVFELGGHTSSVEVSTYAPVSNNWIYLNYALINNETGQAWDFGREISYYFGRDSDGAWTEGSTTDSILVPSVPPGPYYLRVEPEGDRSPSPIHYSVTVKRDVPNLLLFGIGLLALAAPAIFITWRHINFEHLRWAESDHAPAGGDD